MKRKVRKWSFQDNNGDLTLDFSSPVRKKKLVSGTPAPVKSFGRVEKMLEEETPIKSRHNALEFFEKFNDRGSRFMEDFHEIWNLGKGNFGSVVNT